MSNEFAQNQYELWAQKADLAKLRGRAAQLSAEDMDALFLESEKFKPSDRPQEVIGFIMGEGSREEAAFQLQITANALEKVSGVIRVLTAQALLKPYLTSPDKDDLVACIHADEAQLSTMFLKAGHSVRQMKESPTVQNGREYANLDDEIELFITPLFNSIGNEVDRYISKEFDPSLYTMGEEDLIEQIGLARLESVSHTLQANEIHLSKIKKTLDQVTYIEKAREENIIPDSEGVQHFIDDKMKYVAKAMTRAQERLNAVETYLTEVFEMDDIAMSPDDFKARHYVPAPLIKLFDNTP